MFKRILSPFLACCFVLAGCAGKSPLTQQESYVFGTRVEILVYGAPTEQANAAIGEVLREFDRLHHTYHSWQPSELTALNDAFAAGRAQEASAEMLALIRNAQEIAKRGDYLFDPGIGRLVGLWGFQNDDFKAQLPDPLKLAELKAAHPSIADLHIEGNRVSSRNRAVALEFGGYLKGYALDRAAEMLHARGINNALINIGGNIMALGSKGGTPWRVGIQHPRSSAPLASLDLQDGEAIGTSGDYQRYFDLDGKRYCHLIDPRTAAPAQGTQAVTILIPAGAAAGTRSDALSKPLFVAGKDWRKEARNFGLDYALRIDDTGTIHITEALQKRIHFEQPDLRVTLE